MKPWIAAAALLAGSSAAATQAEQPSVPAIGPIQAGFDEMGAAVQSLTLPSGRIVHFTDTGEAGWRPVLFVGGTGTSGRAAGMTDFLKTLRRQLHLRFITVERNGFGDTAYQADWGVTDYAGEVKAVLDSLSVTRFAGVAISGGGPYIAAVASAMPERVISLHLLATAASKPDGPQCGVPLATVSARIAPTIQNPQSWWGFPQTSPTRRIPGFADRAFEEGARTFFIRGQMGDPTPEAAEMQRYCKPGADVSKVTAPVTIYQGGSDPLVTMDQAEYWQKHYPNVTELRVYPGEGHDVQYRHWDQALIELAGFTGQRVLCSGGKSITVAVAEADKRVAAGATIGICAWAPK